MLYHITLYFIFTAHPLDLPQQHAQFMEENQGGNWLIRFTWKMAVITECISL